MPSAPAPAAPASSSWVIVPPMPSAYSVPASFFKDKITEVVNEMPKNPEPVVQVGDILNHKLRRTHDSQSKRKITLEEERRQLIERDKESARAWEALLAGPIKAAANRGVAKPLATIPQPAAAPGTPVVNKPAIDEVKKDSMSQSAHTSPIHNDQFQVRSLFQLPQLPMLQTPSSTSPPSYLMRLRSTVCRSPQLITH